MKKWNLLILVLVFMIPQVLGMEFCEDYLDGNMTCMMLTPNIQCDNYTYDVLNSSGVVVEEGNLSLFNGEAYYFNFSYSRGDYLVRFCNGVTREIYVGGKDRMVLAILILIPLIFGLFMIIGAATLGEDHNILKIFLFLLSPITVWTSFHFGMISLVYTHGLPELQEAIGSTTYWMGWLFFVLISYFVIYVIWKWANVVAQKKKKKQTEIRY